MPEKGKPRIFGERALEVWTLGRNFYRGGGRWVEETEGKGKGARPLLSPATLPWNKHGSWVDDRELKTVTCSPQ